MVTVEILFLVYFMNEQEQLLRGFVFHSSKEFFIKQHIVQKYVQFYFCTNYFA